MKYSFLDNPTVEFPSTDKALKDPNGLLAIGGELSPEYLLPAYCRGIFPWFSEGDDIHWWSPTPRMVLIPEEAHESRSMIKHINNMHWKVKVNSRFKEVIDACAESRISNSKGTWITQKMRSAYLKLHQQGYAHSFEVLDGTELIGGLYGVGLGNVFFGESMFSYRANASKVAFLLMAKYLRMRSFPIIDCQVKNPHLESLGAREIERSLFESILKHSINTELITLSKSDWLRASNKVISTDGHLID